MADWHIPVRGAKPPDFPPVCVVCGGTAADRVSLKTHCRADSGIPWAEEPPRWERVLGWTLLTLSIPLIVFAIIAGSSSGGLSGRYEPSARLTLQLPVCSRHRSYWRWRMWIAVAALGIAVLPNFFLSNGQPRSVMDWFGWWTMAGLASWAVFVIVLHFTTVRFGKLTAKTITIRSVSPAFLLALADADR